MARRDDHSHVSRPDAPTISRRLVTLAARVGADPVRLLNHFGTAVQSILVLASRTVTPMPKKLCAAPHVCAARKVANIFASEKISFEMGAVGKIIVRIIKHPIELRGDVCSRLRSCLFLTSK
jgi:hypothetical protein